jgi:UDP:flavonoid glycosyltransferase YjiC (YdhE family)
MTVERAMFITSNGTGLGHLTRSMAIARRLDGLEPIFLTLSAAAPVVRGLGFPVEYVASHATPGAGSDWRWSRRLRGRLRAAIAEAAPRVVVFDGAHPYLPLLDAMRSGQGARRVWCRRPLWRPGTNLGAIGREEAFDAVLEPGEFAADLDRGPTVARREHAFVVDPIVFCDDDELLPRAEAERELGLDPDAVKVLVALGQGIEVRAAAERCLRHLAGRDGVQVVALSSAIAADLDVAGDVVHLRATYPISRYYRAFDAVVAAAGYNAYHELIRFGPPALFVPMRRETDDQPARARHAQDAGVGLAALADGPLEDRLDELLDPAARERMRERLGALRPPNGAADAARWLEALAAEPLAGGPAAARGQRFPRLPATPREAVRMPRHAAAFVKQTIQRRPPRTLVLALGLPPDALEEALAGALADTPDTPDRVLVVTDSLELEPLRRAGVAFEHVPARGERQPALAGGNYERFVRGRLALILGERPRPKRVVTLGSADASVLPA